jgi:hypothetical protein
VSRAKRKSNMKRNYLTVGEVNRAAQTVQRLAWRGAGRKGKSPPWHDVLHEQRNACREVARWHLRKLREAKRR